MSPYSTPEIEVRKLFPTDSIIALSEKGNKKDKQFYLAIKEKEIVSAYVVIVDLRPFDNTNFAYKIIPESSFPYAGECPKRILKLLSPTNDENSLKWRNCQGRK